MPDSLALPPPAPPDTTDHLSEQTLEQALPPLAAIHGAFAEVQRAHIQIPSWLALLLLNMQRSLFKAGSKHAASGTKSDSCRSDSFFFACLQVDVYTPLKAMLDKAWIVWEMTLLAEPLLVVAPSPGVPQFQQDNQPIQRCPVMQ